MRVSKTTLNGLLAFFISGVPLAMADPNLHIPIRVAAYLSLLLGLARLGVGVMQQDADQVAVKTPEGTAQVPAHPEPDDPSLASKVVTKS